MGRSNLKTFVRYLKNAKTKNEKKAVFDLLRVKTENIKSVLAVKKARIKNKETLLSLRKDIKNLKKTIYDKKINVAMLKKKVFAGNMAENELEKDLNELLLNRKNQLDPRSIIRKIFEEIRENPIHVFKHLRFFITLWLFFRLGTQFGCSFFSEQIANLESLQQGLEQSIEDISQQNDFARKGVIDLENKIKNIKSIIAEKKR